MWRRLLIAAALFAACGADDTTSPDTADASADVDTDVVTPRLAACLDRPALPVPTTGLSCELIPPGLVLDR